MTFIPVSTQLLQAVKSNNAIKVEELILNSDTKRELILEHVLEHGEKSLANLLPRFRSKGLVLNIQSLLNI
ncbi:hypothetical protein [Arcobacter roscoffensis]|uniref:Uncharacterized protein n=1 Tax=Arcobacter roscoffensis TaxID=2961520 RepID=A0ABY5E2W2_9BACT|nr:hypothetical protein [Arcobacter roscoffensis]UTJ05862.1 hypothetical protein NJU99_11465 [Arcobacter roscoffensis]